jgi:hypothetical protein
MSFHFSSPYTAVFGVATPSFGVKLNTDVFEVNSNDSARRLCSVGAAGQVVCLGLIRTGNCNREMRDRGF